MVDIKNILNMLCEKPLCVKNGTIANNNSIFFVFPIRVYLYDAIYKVIKNKLNDIFFRILFFEKSFKKSIITGINKTKYFGNICFTKLK